MEQRTDMDDETLTAGAAPTTVLDIAGDFSRSPGGRLIRDGLCSGELFRKEFLAPALRAARNDMEILEVRLDGTRGLSPDFLEEAFGGLIGDGIPYWLIRDHMEIVSDENPDLITEVWDYISEANLRASIKGRT